MLLCGVAQCKVVDSEEVCHHHLQLFHSTSLANFLCDRKERIKVRQNVPLFVYIILCRIPLIRQKLILTSHLYLAKNLGQSRQPSTHQQQCYVHHERIAKQFTLPNMFHGSSTKKMSERRGSTYCLFWITLFTINAHIAHSKKLSYTTPISLFASWSLTIVDYIGAVFKVYTIDPSVLALYNIEIPN